MANTLKKKLIISIFIVVLVIQPLFALCTNTQEVVRI